MPSRRPVTIQTQGLVDKDCLREALALLREALPAGLTRNDLAGRLGREGVSLRTVDRTLALLEGQGAVISRVRTGHPPVMRLVLKGGPAWDEHVSPEARLALRLATLSLSHGGTLLWEDKLRALESLTEDRMSNRDRQLFGVLAKAVEVQGGVEDPIEGPDILEPILNALEKKREILVDYASVVDGGSRQRRLVPYRLTHDLFSGASFLMVWDPDDRKPKNLRLSRIEAVRVGTRPGTIPNEEVMERAARYQIGGWICADLPFEVQVRITGAHWVQAIKEAPPALPDFAADPAPDGQSLLTTFKANHANGPIRWILQFGRFAQTLAPAWLAGELADHMAEAARNHAQALAEGDQASAGASR